MRLVGQDAAVVERKHHTREEQVVGKHRVPIEHAVALGALVHADAARRFVLAACVGVEHVAADLGDIHPPVAVERDRRRGDDVAARRATSSSR